MNLDEHDVPLLVSLDMDWILKGQDSDRKNGIVLIRYNNHMLLWFQKNGYFVSHHFGELPNGDYIYVWV